MRNRVVTPLVGALLGFLLSFSAIACLVTGFDMAVSLPVVALWCFVSALLAGLFCSLSLGFLPFVAAGLVGVILWLFSDLEAG
ncbi:MAG: hypothetical protein J6Q54_05060, partial [Oscillospiraceae bacterium]|nr:hypothetical protein [Oscillospiraceae bacterium]